MVIEPPLFFTNMKVFISFLVICLYSIGLFSQGVYLTESDFLTKKISFKRGNRGVYKIDENVLFNKKLLSIKINDTTYYLFKDSIFGYMNKQGISFRFYKGKTYQIINPSETILLYKIRATPATKLQKASYEYYYSANASDSIEILSYKNLIDGLKKNKLFASYLELYFSDESNLLEFDTSNNMYKINRLLQLSIQNK